MPMNLFPLAPRSRGCPKTAEGRVKAPREISRHKEHAQRALAAPRVGPGRAHDEDLLVTLDTDVPKARAILQRVLRPFTLTPDGASYRISGALDLSAMLGSGVSEKSSSGGVI
jgi:hypothetical protein